MNRLALIASGLLTVFLSLSAWAGTVPAGPAGGGVTAVGSVVIPPFARDDDRERHTQTISSGEAQALAQKLRMIQGAQSNASGTYLVAPITLADGSPAMISVDTGTGLVTVVKQ